MKTNKTNTYFVTKIIPEYRDIYQDIGNDWVLIDEYNNKLFHSPCMDEILINANLLGIENKKIYLMCNRATGDVTPYFKNDYHFKKLNRIFYV